MDQPNILLIVIDSARVDRFSCYGYDQPTTPNIDAIAAQGTCFDAAYSESSWTLPVCFTLFTGLAPREHRAEVHRKLPDEMPTLPEVLRRRGYYTFGASGNTFVGPRCSLNRGFDEFFIYRRPWELSRLYVKYVAQRLGWADEGGAAVTKRFLDVAGRLKGPWFVLLWYNDAHHPYLAKQPFTTRFCREPIPFGERLSLVRRMRRIPQLAATASAEDLARIGQLYDGGIGYDDMLVGQVCEALQRRGLWDETVVIITADHGEMLGERGLMGHGRAADMYRPLLQVPLIVRAPGVVPAGKRSSALVQLADIPHTIAGLAAASSALADTAAPVVDLVASARGGAARPYAISEREQFSARSVQNAQRKNPRFNFEPHLCHMTAVVQDNYKLIYRSNGRNELYDLAADPHEEHNLIDAQPQRARELTRIIHQWREDAAPHPATVGLAPDDDQIVERRLQELGYY